MSRRSIPGIIALAGGGAALLGAIFTGAAGWAEILAPALWGITIVLGAAFFAAVKVLSGARWWDRLRPVVHALCGSMAAPAVALIACLALGLSALYPWSGEAAGDPLIQAKEAWLNPPFFLARAGVILVVWFTLLAGLRKRLRWDASAGTREAHRHLVRTAIVFTIAFAATISIAFWDWGMSLEPSWFSTIYGVYGFAAAFRAGIAAVAVAAVVLSRRGGGEELRPETTRLLSSMLLAFSMFWAYIWISQYLLVWYSDLPEEALHYTRRLSGGWSMTFWLNPVVGFAVPFLVLLPLPMRRRTGVLLQVAAIVLVAHWIDMFQLVVPAARQTPPLFPWIAVCTTLAVAAGILLLMQRSLDRWGLDGAPCQPSGVSRETAESSVGTYGAIG